MKILDLLASFHNYFADMDFLWWPFSFLRPQKNEPMRFKNVLQLTGAFGGLTFVFFLAFALMNNALTLDFVLLSFIGCLLSFFLWFLLITRPLWNRRALRLHP